MISWGVFALTFISKCQYPAFWLFCADAVAGKLSNALETAFNVGLGDNEDDSADST